MAVAPPPCSNLHSFHISDPHQSLFYHQVLSAGTSIDNNGAVTMAGQSLFTNTTNNNNNNNHGAESTPSNNFGSPSSSGACCWEQLQPSTSSTITTTTTTTTVTSSATDSTQPFFNPHPLSGSHVNPLNQISSATHGNPQLVYPTDEDILLGGETSEFLQQLTGCTPVMHPNLVSTLKNMVQPAAPPLGCYSPLQHFIEQQQHSDSLGLGTLFSAFQGQCHQQVVTSELPRMDVVASGVTTPTSVFESQPLPLASLPPPDHPQADLQKVELHVDEDMEADVVPVALIQNRRPFRCGHEGCAKTFKNPQTMKMHHKTHYTDGSAANRGGLMTLPTLTSSLKAGQNKKIPSRCPKCKKTFVGLYELRRHYGRKHSEGEKPFGCRKCGKKFYIEVDVRDHEKLCGEPIECKCGLKFAFKCNLVAHKKAHPACQDQSLNISNNSSANTTSTNSTNNNNNNNNNNNHHQISQQPTFSDNSNSTQTKGSSSIITTCRAPSSKRQRLESDSALSPLHTNNLHKGLGNISSRDNNNNNNNHHHRDFKHHHHHNNIIPEVPEFKAMKYDFSGLQFSTEGTSMWGCNMHYPMTSMQYNVGGDIGHHSSSSLFSTKAVPQAPFFETFNPADLNHSSSEANLRSANLRTGNPLPGMGIVHLR